MPWKEVSIPDVATQTKYAGRRIRRTIIEEYVMHGGVETTVFYPVRYEIWED